MESRHIYHSISSASHEKRGSELQNYSIAPDKIEYPQNIFSYISMKTYLVGTH